MIAKKIIQGLFVIAVQMVFCTLSSYGQQVAVRNNLLYDATLSPNLGLEIRLDSTWTLGTNVGLNLWDMDKDKNKKWRHAMVAPFVRHYNDTLFHRSFWGLHAVYSHYNVGGVTFPLGFYKSMRDTRRQGDLVALGGSFGYNWRLSGRLHLEAELGLALGYTWYKEYDCITCGAYHGKNDKLFLLPKLGLNLVWNIGRKPVRIVPETPVVPLMTDTIVEVIEPPVLLSIHDVPDNTGRAGELQTDNPVLEHISKYRPYDRSRILRREKGALYVHFPVSKYDVRHDFAENGPTLDRIVDITRQVLADTTSTVKKIQLIGLASVEGPVSGNERLATNRALALQRYLQQQVPTPDSLYDTVGGGEAWADLRDLLCEAASVPGGSPARTTALNKAIEVIDNEPDADSRERKLKRLDGGKPWQYIKQELLPQLRNSGYIRIYYDYVPDTAAAIINRASELLRTDCDDCHRQALTMLQQVRTDERAQNAIGTALYLCGRKEEALPYFRRAAANGNADAKENLRQIEK